MAWDDPPPGVVDRRDGSTKGERGITTMGCLFCPDQIAGSAKYVQRYDQVEFSNPSECQMATCPNWHRPGCEWAATPSRCPALRYWKQHGEWPS